MSDKSKIGLIGTGRIGQVHAANVASLPGVTLRSAAKDGSIDVDPNA
jgi:predicted homoserine dehydrogenase-like protein